MLVAALMSLGLLSMDTQPFSNSPGESMPPWAYGALAAVFLLLLLGITFMFKNVGKRH